MIRVVALLAVLAAAGAQAQPAVQPVYHGCLEVRAAGGPFDRVTGDARLRVPRWRFILTPDSNGIFPAAEQILIAIGENQAAIDPGAMRVSRNGKVFTYRGPEDAPQPAIRRLRIKERKDGSYGVRFTLTGLRFQDLVTSDPLCLPGAIIVGDDDFFAGIKLVRPGSFLRSKRFAIPSDCEIGSDWPWLGDDGPAVCAVP